MLAPLLVSILAPGFDPEKAALTVTLARVMYPFILLVSLAALVMGMLNAKHVFGVPAMASSFFNLGSIIGGVALAWWMDPAFGTRALVGLAMGTLVGGFLQFAVQVPSLFKAGLRFPAGFQLARSGRAQGFAVDGAGGDRGQRGAGECADQQHLRLLSCRMARSAG